MFVLKDFILNTLKGMIGNYPDFQVREYALNWYSKGKLTEVDLADVEEWIGVHNYVPPEPDPLPEPEYPGGVEEGLPEENKSEEDIEHVDES